VASQKLLTVLALIFGLVFALAAYSSSQEVSELYAAAERLGLNYGCSTEYLIPASDNKTGVAACYKSEACNLWEDPPTCVGLTPHSKWLAARQELTDKRVAVDARQARYGAAAFVLGYVLVGWYFHSLLLAVLLRFMLLKWALLSALALDALTINVVGSIRALVGLLRLPTRDEMTSTERSQGLPHDVV
jgi:hypothetical protein